MRGVDHSGCNWDGDDVVNGCPALKVLRMSIQGRESVTQYMRNQLTKLNLILLKTFLDKSVNINRP